MLNLLFPTLLRLGPLAVFNVTVYRLACRFGIYRLLSPVRNWESEEPFFTPEPAPPPVLSGDSRQELIGQAGRLLEGELDYFSNLRAALGSPPDWFLDPFSGEHFFSNAHWSKIDEFGAGDIKNVWEASRFEWVPLLAQAWRLTCDEHYLETLNSWLLDWAIHNPVNSGPNWRCGQEASIRVINLLLTARLLGTHRQPSPALVDLITLHCGRIFSTIHYAVAQNNNHGTSEAAALFIGGAWLLVNETTAEIRQQASRWRDAGRRRMEDRVTTLIAEDGSFSQYSVNYHRVLLDTLCQVELWCRELDEVPFSAKYVTRCHAAVDWLTTVTDIESGDAPNLGANDGARLYDLSASSFRDFRPSVQLASILFKGHSTYLAGPWDEPLQWLGIDYPESGSVKAIASVIHPDGGDFVLSCGSTHGFVRFASFKYRPSHADCLHLDLWHNGMNLLRDGGTYSYNTKPQWLEYFSGTESHNTVQFDGRNQMPRISRFLFGAWLRMDECTGIRSDGNRIFWTGSYTDWKQARHRRTVSVIGNVWRVIDEINGFHEKAVLRWRLIPADWNLTGTICESALARITVSTLASVRRMELVSGWESLYYQQKTELPVFEVEVAPGNWTIETEVVVKA